MAKVSDTTPAPQKAWTAAQVRRQFVEFFVEKCGHTEWPSASVVPHHDPTLLFVNAGMNQFKAVFLGDIDENSPLSKVKRVVNSQKCIRAGGKHNDLEEVGRDCYHNTFFEMLGNWSFGDFFKKEAISWAWELMVNVYGIDKTRFYATYFGGDPKCPDCPPDLDAKNFWEQFLPADRVMPFGMKDNFWEMGDTGPCGPCSELHYDRIGGRDATSLVNADDPMVVELWNLVFMQYNREPDGSLTPLPAPCVDTGMGFERVLSVLQDKTSSYDTDLFDPIFQQIQKVIPNVPDYGGKVGADDTEMKDFSYRVLADHCRTLTVAIADGALPSNEGRGYVLRRILRRAVRYGRQFLGAPKHESWFAHLVDPVIAALGDAFPELKKNPGNIKQVIAEEETQFAKTLDKGVEHFEKAVRKLGSDTKTFPGQKAFELYATFGFPLDLTQLMAEERKMEVDVTGFNEAFERHQRASDQRPTGHGDAPVDVLSPEMAHELEHTIAAPPTEDAAKFEWSPDSASGCTVDATVHAIFDGKKFLQQAVEGQVVSVIVDKTNYYSESGGQIGDRGTITTTTGTGSTSASEENNASQQQVAEFQVLVAKKFAKFVLHVGTLTTGVLQTGAKVSMEVDYVARARTAKNHTGTHILNFALRKVLGNDCDQKGSLVEPNRLRFDFAAQKAMTDKQLADTEEAVCTIVKAEKPVHAEEVAFAKAKSIAGLRAVFGEVYPDPVRVVSVGCRVDEAVADGDVGLQTSIEFCGGTHLKSTKTIEDFVIIGEESISKGVRRLLAVTGDDARDARKYGDELQRACREAEKLSGTDLDATIVALSHKISETKDSIPSAVRKECKDALAKLQRKRVEEGKAKQKQLMKKAEELGTQAATEFQNRKSNDTYFVLVDNALAGEFKAMEVFVQHFQKIATKVAVCLLSAGPDSLALYAVVPKGADHAEGASAWVADAATCFPDCKSGGKFETARGTVKGMVDRPKVEAAVAKAKAFGAAKMTATR